MEGIMTSLISKLSQYLRVVLIGLCLCLVLPTCDAIGADLTTETACPHGCHCHQSTVDCSGRKLVAIPHISSGSKQVTSLLLANNSIQEISYSDFEQFEDLEFLALSDNHIDTINNGSLQSLGNLTSLQLAGNNLSSLTVGCFTGLLMLQVLELHDNKLTSIQGRAFIGLSKVERISLSNNVIRSVDKDAFFGLRALKTLDISGNDLHQVPSASLRNLHGLQNLVLARNHINELTDCSFERLHELKVVQLGNNNISNLSGKAFAPICIMGATQKLYPCPIHSLDLSENRLTDLNPTTMVWFQNLETLNLNRNDFVSIKTGTFHYLPALEVIYSSFLPFLTHVQVKAFDNLKNLFELRIHDCPLFTSLDEGAFYNIPELKILKLNNNGLTTISENLLEWSDISDADFIGNPFSCDCKMKWIKDQFQSHNMTSRSEEMFCQSPNSLTGMRLFDIRPDLLICEKPRKTSHARLKTALGAVAICLALVLIASVLIKFRNRLCISLKRQFQYKAQRDNARELFSVKLSDITEDHDIEAVPEEAVLTTDRREPGFTDNIIT